MKYGTAQSKLTVTRISILETRDLILDPQNFLGWRIRFQILSWELVLKVHSLKVYTYLSFLKLLFCALGETQTP